MKSEKAYGKSNKNKLIIKHDYSGKKDMQKLLEELLIKKLLKE
ncbi:hypothetical protein [Alkaliphilus pronyensis]|nr:hypothetical protein [Alkaliphilus pronyensis]